MKQKNIFSKLFRVIASVIANLSDEEIDNLLSGKATLTYQTLSISKEEQKTPPKIENNNIVKELSECEDRKAAKEILSKVPNKETLTSIAKSLKVHVVKYDRREDIENKLIEFVIGAKLRTEAIGSLNMKGGNG
jgi:hypothetical protein